MTLEQAREHVGDGVVYQGHPGAVPEQGVIVRVGDRSVFVRYAGDLDAKSTDPEDLTLLYQVAGGVR